MDYGYGLWVIDYSLKNAQPMAIAFSLHYLEIYAEIQKLAGMKLSW